MIDVQKPTRLATTNPTGPRYPAFTKLGQVLGKPSGWTAYTYSRNAADGPFSCGVIDTHAVGRTDLAYRYYLVTGHDHPPGSHDGGIFLAASNDPETGWAFLNSGSVVIDATDLNSGDDGDELAAPNFIDYNAAIDRFVIYPHTRGYTGPTGDEQVTVRIITQDMASWSGDGADGSVVICGQGGHHGYAYGFRQGGRFYLDHRREGIDGFLESRSESQDADNKYYTPLPEFDRPGSIQCWLPNSQDFAVGAHQSFFLGGQCWGLFNVRPASDAAAGQRGEEIWIAPLDPDDRYTITGPGKKILARGGASAIDEIACHMPCVMVTDRAVYVYYCAERNTTWQQVICVARCRIKPDGSYET